MFPERGAETTNGREREKILGLSVEVRRGEEPLQMCTFTRRAHTNKEEKANLGHWAPDARGRVVGVVGWE